MKAKDGRRDHEATVWAETFPGACSGSGGASRHVARLAGLPYELPRFENSQNVKGRGQKLPQRLSSIGEPFGGRFLTEQTSTSREFSTEARGLRREAGVGKGSRQRATGSSEAEGLSREARVKEKDKGRIKLKP